MLRVRGWIYGCHEGDHGPITWRANRERIPGVGRGVPGLCTAACRPSHEASPVRGTPVILMSTSCCCVHDLMLVPPNLVYVGSVSSDKDFVRLVLTAAVLRRDGVSLRDSTQGLQPCATCESPLEKSCPGLHMQAQNHCMALRSHKETLATTPAFQSYYCVLQGNA